jgi:hypothetical protein
VGEDGFVQLVHNEKNSYTSLSIPDWCETGLCIGV